MLLIVSYVDGAGDDHEATCDAAISNSPADKDDDDEDDGDGGTDGRRR